MRRVQLDPGISEDSVLVEGHWFEDLVAPEIFVETDVPMIEIVQEGKNAAVTEILLCFIDN